MDNHSIIQGTPEWHEYRAKHFNASDAPAMMGVSPYKSRTELLRERFTGLAPEVNSVTQSMFDRGHHFESLARPLAEKIIGDDLYPVTGSLGELSASFDGLTICEDVAFEHKTLNDEIREANSADDLGLHYRIQMEQQLLVSGAAKCLFMATKWDNEDQLIEEKHFWYESDAELREKIIAGWKQFAIDLAEYQHVEIIQPALAAPQMSLPSVSIQVNGSIALVDNLDLFGKKLAAFVESINKAPETDQDFADLEATVKTLKSAEEALDAAESSVLAQIESFDAMRRMKAMYHAIARDNRLLVEKLVKSEKENRRAKILSSGQETFAAHIKSLNDRLGKAYMPVIASDFAGTVKGLKSLDSMKGKIADELARCKIAANETADRISANLVTLTELASEYKFLFSDTSSIVLKANDDLIALVKTRISEHQEADAKRLEAERARIQVEEEAKAAAKVKAEQEAAHAIALEAERQATIASIPKTEEVTQEPITVNSVARLSQVEAFPLPVARPATESTPPTLTLGQITTRLGFGVTADFLKSLGFEATTVRAAKLYHDTDFSFICAAIVKHIESVQSQVAA
jgi:putative phage-type endonuclease